MVKRAFNAPGIVSGQPEIWSKAFPEALVSDDDDALSFAKGAHDFVLHAMSLHWANDPVGQLIQCRHALKPDGLMIAICLGGETLQELRRCLSEAEIALLDGLSPRVAPMAELRDLGGLLQRAGFALPVADALPLKVEYRDIWHLMRDLRAMGETNALSARLRTPTPRALFEKADAIYKAHFATDSGRIRATFELLTLTGWAPSADQPQPLRPGSATTRLAEALGTSETPLRD